MEEPTATVSGHPLTKRPFHLTERFRVPVVDFNGVYEAIQMFSLGLGCAKLTGSDVLSWLVRITSGLPAGASQTSAGHAADEQQGCQ